MGLASALVVSCSLGLLQGYPRILASRLYVATRPHAFMSLAVGGLKLDGSVGHDCWGLVRHHKLWGSRRRWGHLRPLDLRGRMEGEPVRHQGVSEVVAGEDVEINALEWREGKQVVWHRDHPQPRQIRDMIRLRRSHASCDCISALQADHCLPETIRGHIRPVVHINNTKRSWKLLPRTHPVSMALGAGAEMAKTVCEKSPVATVSKPPIWCEASGLDALNVI